MNRLEPHIFAVVKNYHNHSGGDPLNQSQEVMNEELKEEKQNFITNQKRESFISHKFSHLNANSP